MIKRILNPAKALRTLSKTSALLARQLAPITQGQAQTLRDGADGWTILEIACHLRDYERIVGERVRLILDRERPELPGMDNAALQAQNRYGEQDLRAVLADLDRRRQGFALLLGELSDEQWLREGVHPEQGAGSILDIAINAGLHDLDHLEQLARCIAPERQPA